MTASVMPSAYPLRRLLGDAAARSPGRTALVFAERHWSYAELDALATTIANDLRTAGVAAGDAVGMALGNSPRVVAAYFAAWELGAAVMEANPSLSEVDALAVFERAGVAATVGDESIAPGTALRHHGSAASDVASDGESTLACINLTSGSTGAPKGVLLPARNLLRNAELYEKYFGLREDDRTCLVLPLYFGMNKIALLAHVRLGATVLLEPGFATPNVALAAMHREHATGLCAVPSSCQTLLTRGDLARYPQPDLRYLRIGAGRVPEAMMRQLQQAFPSTEIYLTYGLTEVGLVTCFSAAEFARKPESVGRPIDEVRVTIDSDPGSSGSDGEVVIHADHAASGYWHDDAQTGLVFRADGLHTGDAGRLDADGYLMLTGRLKDLIKSGGENVYPREVEAALLSHGAVADCAVLGVPDRWLGEVVQAYVVVRSGSDVSVPELTQHCLARLAPVQRPRRIVLVEEIPRNAVGKVVRARLVE